MSETPTKGFYDRLAAKGGYSQTEMAFLRPKVERLSGDLQSALEEWLLSDSIADIQVEGYSAKSLMENQRLEPVAAILTLDWLRREPEAASRAIERGYSDLRQ